ncbi:hypothetical protein RvY_14354 [Ramazzottius varieornatus]|uniref:Uncharacterized protein n=1 Tax=Ramazzottius varieornatus TaxID=947166 RepID=A0A1D1VSZ6_RAMVA|nr:hypothetical protein RvY_14354 [Ramazzottius varieornatus]
MFTLLATVSCIVALGGAQVMTNDEPAPDRLQMYQLLDDKADLIFRTAQDLGAAIDAMRAGRSREFLKNTMGSSGSVAEDSIPRDGPRADAPFAPIGTSFAGPLESAPFNATPVIASPPTPTRAKRSYYGGGRSYGSSYGGSSYGGYGRSYGGYGSSYGGSGYGGSMYGGGYGGGMRYGGYGGRYYG